MRQIFIIATLVWAGGAAADLYRWVDPESGSVKYSSYPPPWYGDEAKQRRAPRVEHIPARPEQPSRSAEAAVAPPAARPAVPAAVLRAVPAAAPSTVPPATRAEDTEKRDRAIQKSVEARQAEMQSRIERIVKGLPR